MLPRAIGTKLQWLPWGVRALVHIYVKYAHEVGWKCQPHVYLDIAHCVCLGLLSLCSCDLFFSAANYKDTFVFFCITEMYKKFFDKCKIKWGFYLA